MCRPVAKLRVLCKDGCTAAMRFFAKLLWTLVVVVRHRMLRLLGHIYLSRAGTRRYSIERVLMNTIKKEHCTITHCITLFLSVDQGVVKAVLILGTV